MEIRAQNRSTDPAAIRQLNDVAFADHGGTEAFDRFRTERDDILSLVATRDDRLLGHILFSPVTLKTDNETIAGMGLGQLAVMPDYQKQGIGTRLSQAGIAELREQGCPYVIVIGHATYYPRFGFERGSIHNIKCQWEGVPDDSFMVLILNHSAKEQLQGTASFDGM